MAMLRLELRDEPWPLGKRTPALPCPVCGKEWRPWAGSRLPCHGRCLLHEWAQNELLDALRSPDGHPLRIVAERLGIPVGVVTASINAARAREKAKGVK